MVGRLVSSSGGWGSMLSSKSVEEVALFLLLEASMCSSTFLFGCHLVSKGLWNVKFVGYVQSRSEHSGKHYLKDHDTVQEAQNVFPYLR